MPAIFSGWDRLMPLVFPCVRDMPATMPSRSHSPAHHTPCNGIFQDAALQQIERFSSDPLPESGLSSRKSSGTISGMWQPRHRDVPGRERAGRGPGLKCG